MSPQEQLRDLSDAELAARMRQKADELREKADELEQGDTRAEPDRHRPRELTEAT